MFSDDKDRTRGERRDRSEGHQYKGCDCRKRTRGNPKVGKGLCMKACWGTYRAAVEERIRGKRTTRLWAACGDDAEV